MKRDIRKLESNFNTKIKETQLQFRRYLLPNVDWTNRLIAIKGSRGVGKTTMLLQHIKRNFKLDGSVLYTSLDDIYFQANTLVDLAEKFYTQGGKYLFLDEVHKYENWSIEIKNIYDNYSNLHIIFTSSSLLEIYKGDADLSRRAVSYELQGLSFREYLLLEHKIPFDTLSLDDIINNHLDIAMEMTQDIKIIPLFKEYLKMGYYPFYKEGKNSYYQKINNVMNLVIETDIPSVYKVEYQTIYKLKKLLYVIAMSVPFQPNISKLSQKIDTKSRSSTLKYLDYLHRANLTSNLKTSAKGNNYMVKPDKIYLENTNLMYAIGNELREEGNLRETFFLNQLKLDHKVNTSKESDFLIDEKYTFEIGGRNKKQTQIKNTENAYLAVDNLEMGYRNTIPLWMFGFLY